MSDSEVFNILEKARTGTAISDEEGVLLYEKAPLGELARTANWIRSQKTDSSTVTYLVDRNINYTNVCTTSCKFCAFYRPPGHEESYVLSRDEIAEKIKELIEIGGTRILMQGGHHPELRLSWYTELLDWLRSSFPFIDLDCFSPSEIDNLCEVEKKDARFILRALRDAGLAGLPGGGGENLDPEVRDRVSPKKTSGKRWLEIMGIAHEVGLRTTSSMVIGFGESAHNRIRHFSMLRDRQNKSLQEYGSGFLAFISWPLQHEYTALGRQSRNRGVLGAGPSDYLRNLSMSRIFMNNFDHFQASWPTMGFDIAQLALHFGADDFGSTMMEENVVSQASGTTEVRARIQDIRGNIEQAGYKYKQRNSAYEIVG